jgi:hypothetical protein
MLSKIRNIIKEADPNIVEEWKWRGTPVWYHEGMLCTGETYKSIVKVTFAKGAKLMDKAHLFNSSMEGNARRAIDIQEKDLLDEEALLNLLKEAMLLNEIEKSSKKKK